MAAQSAFSDIKRKSCTDRGAQLPDYHRTGGFERDNFFLGARLNCTIWKERGPCTVINQKPGEYTTFWKWKVEIQVQPKYGCYKRFENENDQVGYM